jgi:3-deoxy-D-manno-octulosonic-acid transferase
MHLLYSFALLLLFLALLPYFIFQAIRHGKYAGSFKERMGRLPDFIDSDTRPAVWVHTVSVGEFNAARPLIDGISQRLRDHRIVVSTTTLTGQKLAREHQGKSFDQALYFPFDWAFSVRRALDRVRPRAVIIMETELWPNFLRECRMRDIAVILINGRISERSFSRYLRIRPFISRALEDFSLLVMQSQQDAERALRLGAPAGKVRLCGNLKYDVEENSHSLDALCLELDSRFTLSSSENLIVAGSTAPGEESLLLDALRDARSCDELKNTRLLIAPRHPERFEEVARLISQSEFSFARRSQPKEGDTADVVLLDSIGELAAVYRFASVVFVGGSLARRGGHNILEPAACAKPIIVGPHTENFRQIISDFKDADAIIEVEAGEFSRVLIRSLTDRERSRDMGLSARSLLERNRGATLCAIEAIVEAMGGDR